jgi:hypothetical protein
MIFEIYGLCLVAKEHWRRTVPMPYALEDKLRMVVQQAWIRNVELDVRRGITRLGFAHPYLREAFNRNVGCYVRDYYKLHGAFPQGWHVVPEGRSIFFAPVLEKVDATGFHHHLDATDMNEFLGITDVDDIVLGKMNANEKRHHLDITDKPDHLNITDADDPL